ncbi:MAG TPA: CoA pyrophosphatase [Vicinamibacterales bacterium]
MSPRLPDGRYPPRRPMSRLAAALLCLFERTGRPHIVLTLRGSDLPHHAGQVSLPGGRVEPGETPEQAALREAHEEVGLAAEIVRIAGRLTPIDIPVSGYTLQVVVGVAIDSPVFVPAAHEVAEVIEVPVEELLDTSRIRRTTLERDGQVLDVPCFDLGGLQVWGATAMALAEMIEVLRRAERGMEGAAPL